MVDYIALIKEILYRIAKAIWELFAGAQAE